MPKGLKRYYGAGYLHFITSSCYQRRPILNPSTRRTLFLQVLEEVRSRYDFVVVGYVVMPEHFHLLMSEPQKGTPSTVMQVLKQRFAWQLHQDQVRRSLSDEGLDEGHVWQGRFYDFVVWSTDKRVEKLNYMHQNPVKRGLVLEPEEWAWSSSRHYTYGERGVVLVNEQQPVMLKIRSRTATTGEGKIAG